MLFKLLTCKRCWFIRSFITALISVKHKTKKDEGENHHPLEFLFLLLFGISALGVSEYHSGILRGSIYTVMNSSAKTPHTSWWIQGETSRGWDSLFLSNLQYSIAVFALAIHKTIFFTEVFHKSLQKVF
jgi:hypothetical protein